MDATTGSPDYIALEQRLHALRADLDASVARSRSRRNVMLVVLALLVLFVACYLYFIYSKLSELDARTVVQLTQDKMQTYIDQGPDALANELKQRAPEMVNRGEQMLLRAPDEVVDRAKSYLSQRLQSELPSMEERIYATVSSAVAAGHEKADAAGIDPSDPRQLEIASKNLTASLAERMDEVITKVYADYTHMADDFLVYLQRLATAPDLDRREQLHRQAIISGLAVLQRAERDSAEGRGGIFPATDAAAGEGSTMGASSGQEQPVFLRWLRLPGVQAETEPDPTTPGGP